MYINQTIDLEGLGELSLTAGLWSISSIGNPRCLNLNVKASFGTSMETKNQKMTTNFEIF